jgi:phage protein D
MEELPVANSASQGANYTDNFMRPNYLITVGSEEFSFEKEPKVISVKVTRNMGLPTDSCEVYLIGGEDYSFEKADAVKIKLGYDAEMELVFSGLLENINYEVNKVRVNALGFGVELLRLRFNRVYLNQTAGKIAKDIAQEASITIGETSDGISFPTYVVDDATDAYEHVLKLAERCNFEVYFTEDEKLVFKEAGGGKNHSLQYGKEIIRLAAFDFSPLCTGANIFGESPSSVKGTDTYHWLTKQEVKGEAGTGTVLTIHDPAIRDKKTAETVAKARMEKLGYTFGLAVETVGKPQIKLGDTVTLENIPNPALTGQLQVRSFEHYLSKNKGFTTVISCWKRSE